MNHTISFLFMYQRARTTRRYMAGILLLVILAALMGPAFGGQPAAANTPNGLSNPLILAGGAAGGGAAWGDYDNDDDLDLLVTGTNSFAQRATILFQNNANTELVKVETNLPMVESSSVDWGDFDNDGYLDVLLTGKQGFAGGQIVGLAGVYRSVPNSDPANPASRSFALAFTLPGVYNGSAKWGDANNDGRLDILLTGFSDGGLPLTRIFHNTGGSFTEASLSGLVDLGGGTAAWGDYNNDGYLDFLINGRQGNGDLRSLVYRGKTSGGFHSPIELTGLWGGSALFFDFDNDADLDLLVTGNRGDNDSNILPTTILYRYASGSFTPISSGLPDIWESSLSAGDYNNDGYSDLLLNGLTTSDRPTRIYLNQSNGTFTDAAAVLPGGTGITVMWGDFNGDAILDVALSGVLQGIDFTTQIFLNNNPPPPAGLLPAAPELIAACWDGSSGLTLDWKKPAMQLAESSGLPLTYNLRMGTSPNGIEISSPEANLDSGYTRLAQPGRLFYGTRAILRDLPRDQSYFWSVQAVNSALAGGPFSPVDSIPLGAVVAVNDTVSTNEDTPVTFDILANDNQAFGPLRVYWHNKPASGTLSESSGVYTFTPDANWNGTTSFSYTAIGPARYCSQATVNITVSPVNDAPTEMNLSILEVPTGAPIGTLVGLFSAVDPDLGDTFTYTLVPNSADNRFFQIDGDKLLTAKPVDYSLNSEFTIHVTLQDAAGKKFIKLFTIQVIPDTPIITCASGCDGYDPSTKTVRVAMSEDGTPVPFALSLRGTHPILTEPLTWSLAAPPSSGTAEAAGTTISGEDLSIQYTPNLNWFSVDADDSFLVRVEDSLGHVDTISVQVQVLPVNDAPSLNSIPNQAYSGASGIQQIALSGVSAGPENEAGQPLSFVVETDRPDLLQDLSVQYPGTGSDAILTMRVVGNTDLAQVQVTLSDGQAENDSISHTFTVTFLDGLRIYLPLVVRP